MVVNYFENKEVLLWIGNESVVMAQYTREFYENFSEFNLHLELQFMSRNKGKAVHCIQYTMNGADLGALTRFVGDNRVRVTLVLKMITWHVNGSFLAGNGRTPVAG